MIAKGATSENEISHEIIWITGGTSGIGLNLVKQLIDMNNRVIVSARSLKALQTLTEKSSGVTSIPCDVTDAQSVKLAAQEIETVFGHIDRVIISAGTCEYFDVENPDWSMMQRVMAVNYFGAINIVAAALPLLRKSGMQRPHIIAVASLAGLVPFPRAEAYGASKAAVSYLFDSLRVDLAASNIDVTVVQPGFVDTPLTKNNDFPMPFMCTAENAATIIIRKSAKRPRTVQFPKKLAWPLRFMHGLPGLWHWLAVNKLVRPERQGG